MSKRATGDQELELLNSNDGLWWVRSGENVYHVDPDRLRCDCRGWALKRPCRHLNFVLAAAERERDV